MWVHVYVSAYAQDFCKLAGITAPRARLPILEQLLNDTSSTVDQVLTFMMNKAAT